VLETNFIVPFSTSKVVTVVINGGLVRRRAYHRIDAKEEEEEGVVGIWY
jgi:hypothetical protein